MPVVAGAYDFLANQLTITGPGGSFLIAGPDTASAEEGFTIEMANEQNVATDGADGSVMMSKMATRRARLTVRLQKTSPVNAQLNALYIFQRSSSANWALNVITHRDVWRGDNNNMTQCAFARHPSVVYAARGNTNEWVFDVGIWDPLLGSGQTNVSA